MLNIFLTLTLVMNIQQTTYSKIINNEFKGNTNEQKFHEDFLKRLYEQKTYEGVLILNENGKHEYCNYFLKYLKFQEMPVTLTSGNITEKYGNYFNNQILSIVCMQFHYYNILEQLAEILNYMRYIRTIIIIDRENRELDAKKISGFFQYCHKLKMLNVVVIFEDFYTTREYVQYTIFPKFKVEFGVYDQNSHDFPIFTERLHDLKGYKLRTIADHSEPRAMEYYNANNETVFNGYIARLVQTIHEVLNTSFYFPLTVPQDIILEYRDIMGYVTNYSIDIPMSTISLFVTDDPRDFSYPLEIAKWCLLLPMEQPLEFKDIFVIVLQSRLMFITLTLAAIFTVLFFFAFHRKYSNQWHYRWPEIIINEMAIRGVLGQGFVSSVNRKISLKLMYLILLLSGLTNSTIFNTYLLSFFTQHPMEPPIKTYQDLAKSPLKLAIVMNEIDYLHNITNGSLAYLYPKLYPLPNFAAYSHFRDSFDRHFAYPTTNLKLFYYNALQSYYGRQFFRFSLEMCPNTMMHFCFPLGPNSYFVPRVNEIVLYILQSGLMNYWRSKSYADVVATGKKIQVNISYPATTSPIYINDLYWIWLYFSISIAVAIVVFSLELLIYKKCKK